MTALWPASGARPYGGSLRTRNRLLMAGAVAGFTALTAASVAVSAFLPAALFVPVGLIAAALAGWLVAAACAGSPIAMMIYFALVSFVTDGQFRVRGAGNIDADWQSLLKFALWLGAGVIGWPHLPPMARLLGRPGSVLWVAYIVMALLSAAYSPIPAYSFGCALALLCLLVFAYALVTTLSEPQILWTFVLTLSVFQALGWVVYYAYPELGASAAWTYAGMTTRICGLAGQANNLGTVSAMFVGAVFLLWWKKRCRTALALAFMALGAVTLIASDSRTMIAATALGLVAVVMSRSTWVLASGTLAALVAVTASLLMPHVFDSLGAHISRSGDPGELSTLNGRGEIWAFSWQQIAEHPYVGWGYNSSKIVLGQHLGFSNGLMVDSAHNLYLQSLLSTGILGTLPLFAVLGLLCSRLVARPAPIVAYYLVVIVIGSISDTSAAGTTPTVLTLFFLLISIWPTRAERAVAVQAAWRPAWPRLAAAPRGSWPATREGTR